MSSKPLSVLLVGFQDQDNLGLRYLASSARTAGHHVDIITWSSDPAALVARARRDRPDVIGLSLIFQYMAPEFARVVEALRSAGIGAHVTMGGHYPSFDYAEVLRRIPGLDSIVRFEGEATLVELLARLQTGEEWRAVHGIAYRLDDGAVAATPLRKQIMDLDGIPPPDRASIDYEGAELATASILGSRGCPWDCSFCSIRPFYEAQEGKLRRLRRPEKIVDEMRSLFHERGVSVFLFQDDDFLATGRRARDWAGEIADRVAESDIGGRVAFKMSCRSDEVREDIMVRLMRGGLTHVYMGVESGDEQGLRNLNKMLKPEAHIRAGEVLKRLGLSFDFGFMLLEPYSTIESARNNVAFLEQFVGDGWSIASFCRMLPYAGAPVTECLRREGRLRGTPFDPDYDFLDPKLDIFYNWMLATFHTRNFTSAGLSQLLRSINFEARLRLVSQNGMTLDERAWFKHVTALCNRTAFHVLREALAHIDATPMDRLQKDDRKLRELTRFELAEEERLTREILRVYGTYRTRMGATKPVAGGFDHSWTLRQADHEAIGVGNW